MNPIILAEEQFKSLPLNIKEAISRIPWKERLKKIASQNNLNSEQSNILEIETMMVLYSLESPIDYLKNITQEVGVGEIVSKTVNDQVFKEIFNDVEKQFEMIEAISKKSTLKTTPVATIKVSEQKDPPFIPVAEVKSPENLPSTKTTALEIPPVMSVVPEGKVMDHLPPIHPTQPKIQVDSRQQTVNREDVKPRIESPRVGTPQIPTPPVSPEVIQYLNGRDPYREPLE